MFHVFTALAELPGEMIVEGTRKRLKAARASGKRLGRSPAMTEEQVRHTRDLLTQPENSDSAIARLLGISRSTLYKHVLELSGGRTALSPHHWMVNRAPGVRYSSVPPGRYRLHE
ncbi:helix-turn-helix domain-containing protein [Haloactinospora alba]|uniref:helix-turn-helix domain-containing protein n=1 Tax=Haloactinospora alba TaxID=405555 RepID=UPI001FE2DFAD|nr:helix-turn-helix domain-containing protein [Haloactinospora alba]